MATSLLGPAQPLPPEPAIRKYVEKIERQLVRIERMLNDFLLMAKIDSGELELRKEQHDVRLLVRAALEQIEGTAFEGRFRLTAPDEKLEVVCDAMRIEQVLLNLTSNAAKYSPAESPIGIELGSIDEKLVLSVRDGGNGLSREEQEQRFEPFRRFGASQHQVPGVGLGLFVVKRIVDAHDGRIEVESAPGKGSVFRVFLPLAPRLQPER